jgi:O-6-methylguanine DNA methyltransferase
MIKDFKEKVLSVVRKIPKGKVMTYKEVAIKVGEPNAMRAVGNIMSKNFLKDVPCHRIIRSDGHVGNYNRGGSSAKIRILRTEGFKGKLLK